MTQSWAGANESEWLVAKFKRPGNAKLRKTKLTQAETSEKHYLANLSSKFLISDLSSLLGGILREEIFLAQLINMLSEFLERLKTELVERQPQLPLSRRKFPVSKFSHTF